MTDQAKVTVEEVRRVAELANLELTPEEEREMLRDLNAILDHVAQLNELDTSEVAPMAQVSEVASARLVSLAAETSSAESSKTAPFGSGLREDIVAPSLDRTAVLACAPETDSVFFKVPKVIDR